jgi:hypothetical protein
MPPGKASRRPLQPVPDFRRSIRRHQFHFHTGKLLYRLDQNRCSWLDCLGVQFALSETVLLNKTANCNWRAAPRCLIYDQ